MNQTKDLLVGITGQSGGGKTLVATYLTKYGYHVIDADIVARKVVEPGSPCLDEIARIFGNELILSNGSLNRGELADIVFNDEAKLKKLNDTIYPSITAEILLQIKTLREHGAGSIFLDAPTLFESGFDRYCDKIVSVVAPRELRSRRIMTRDNLTPEQTEARLSAQQDDDFYISRSDYVIENKDKPHEVERYVISMLRTFGLSEKKHEM